MFGRTKVGRTERRKDALGATASRGAAGPSVLPSFRLTALGFASHVPSPHPQVPPSWLRVLGPRLIGGIRDHPPLRERFSRVPGRHRPAPLGLAAGRPLPGVAGLDWRRAPELGGGASRFPQSVAQGVYPG